MKNVNIWRIAIGSLVVLALNACAGASNEETVEHNAPHWSYEGEEGPAAWGGLDEAYALCGDGQAQSPIDLTGATQEDLANPIFSYSPTEINILNNGHTVQVNYDAGSTLKLDGEAYTLLQFHFHSPSEHTIEGQSFPAEMHLVHANADGELAVVGVMLTEGAENQAFAPVWDALPSEINDAADAGAQVNALDLLPADKRSYRYTGSLTTPPCSEGVHWLIMAEPVELSAAQLAAFQAIVEGNNRPVQPLNGRSLIVDSTP